MASQTQPKGFCRHSHRGTAAALRVSERGLCSHRDSADNVFATSVGRSVPSRGGGGEGAARSLQLALVAQDVPPRAMRLG